ncbi:hypothetical protein ACFQPA_01970 [Halomarina halobia]|uniref:Major facilitator superfamily (MFS) profile domain-containing protein n=1 Tax=Halomarina halobia TaxID=3033386 RepID=A0ABD6A470_9EURY|nr:hypothetical protein [Halomarina sp. PSR21]
MNWSRPVGALAVVVVIGAAVGSLLSLGALFAGEYVTSAVAVLVLVAVAVVLMSALGARSSRLLRNPYW